MRITKKILSLILALVMVLSLLPATVFATGSNNVYISVSYNGQYINDQNGAPIVYVPISLNDIASVDLEEYDLGDYIYDEDGDGTPEITALHLVIYAHENIYGGSWDDVSFSGSPGGSYFEGGIFGFTENLNYFLNGRFPIDEAQSTETNTVGATSDHIVLAAGDCLDIASFSSFAFLWDSNAGFHIFADSEDNYIHNYTVKAESALPVKLLRSYTNMADGSAVLVGEGNYEISYGAAFGEADGTVTTDDSGNASLTFEQAGTYYLWCDGGYGLDAAPEDIVSSPAFATVTVTAKEAPVVRQPQSVSTILNAAMAKLASTVTEPAFGTTAGEWTVLSLARGGYYAKDNTYFTDYYNRIVNTVNTEASSVNDSGKLHTSKSTDNSRLIVALASIGRDATSVGNWNLITPYDDFDWIKRQGLNGPIWALIALDSNDYATTDATIRQQCVDAILAAQHTDGGWSLMANKELASDPDITGMALTALYPYRDQAAVTAACAEAISCLSGLQHDNGTFASGGSECSESCAWAIIACSTWGINPDTDSRFIKNGKSAVDGLLAHYVEEESMFEHIIGAGTNAMGTDQGCYGLVAYDRLINNEPGLYDFSDVTFDSSSSSGGGDTGSGDTEEPEGGSNIAINATLAIPNEIENEVGKTFNATITVDKWDNTAGFKLIDFLMTIPDGLSVTGVTAGDRLLGGEASFNLNTESSSDEDGNTVTVNNLRCAYFDANNNSDLTVTGTEFPVEVFTIAFEIKESLTAETLDFSIVGMSVKLNSDSSDEDSQIVVNTKPVTDSDGTTSGGGSGSVGVVTGISYSAVELYTGDDIDLIPSTKKAVAVAVTGITNSSALVYNDGTNNIPFQYSSQITEQTGIATFVALVDAKIEIENFIVKDNFTIDSTGVNQSNITFGNVNDDNVTNAQDALAVVEAWLRKTDAPTDDMILRMNVNGDSRINTYDALGIVEAFVNTSTYGVVTKAAVLANQQ